MKIFIYLFCLAHLLTVISARLRLTTSMPSLLRSKDDMARQTSNIAEMIEFVNSVFNENARIIARRDPTLRRLVLTAVEGINLPASTVVSNDEGTENQLENLADTVRYQVIDNPEVLEEYSNKQMQKKNEKLLNPVSVVSGTSTEAKSFSAVENKLKYYNSKSEATASNNSTNSNNFDTFYHTPYHHPPVSVQELTTVESTYRPSFPDDDDDYDDKLVTEDIEATVTEKEINTPRADEKNSDGLPKINDTVKIEKRTLDNKALAMEDQARIEEENAHMDDTKGQIKHELLRKKNKNNDRVTVNEEKRGSKKEYISTKLDYNSNKRPSEDNIRPRDEDYKNKGNKKINGTTDTNSEKDKLNEKSWDANKRMYVPAERLMGRIDKSALRTKKKNNSHDHKEHHSIYSHKERNKNSNKQFKNSHEKRDEYDTKQKDKKYDRWSEKENDWAIVDKQRYDKDNGYDRMEYEWNKRHQQYDENDNWNINGNQWDKNDDFNSRDHFSNKRDNDWNEKDNDWKKREFDSNKRDSDWNNRDFDSNKREMFGDDDRNNKDNYWNKRDIDSNTKDSDWNKRDDEWMNR